MLENFSVMMNSARQVRVLLIGCILVLIAAGAWWGLNFGPPAENSAESDDDRVQRNAPVVIYLVDTLRADRLGLYGYPKVTSWRIDALANDSAVFDQAYAPAPWTLPSVTSLITSTFSCEHIMTETMKTQAERVSAIGPGPGLRTLAERLAAIDYASAGVIENAVVGRSSGLHRGYQEYVLRTGKESKVSRARDVRLFLNRVGRRPFLLYVHTMEPHNPLSTPERFIQRIGDVDLELMQEHRVSVLRYNSFRHYDWKNGQAPGTTDNTDQQSELLEHFASRRSMYDIIYDAAVLRADANLGEMVSELKDRGLWDEAIFIFLSDHGEEFGEHGGWFHGQSVYEELSRVPLLIHFPDGEFAGQRVTDPVSLVDIMPTIFDYMGRADLCTGCRGTSLLPLLRGEGASASDGASILGIRQNRINYYRPWKQGRGDVNVVIRQAQWKGIWNDELSTLELYDLQRDPGEQTDRSAEYPDMAQALGARARDWLQECRAEAKPPQALGEIDEQTQEQLRALGYFN